MSQSSNGEPLTSFGEPQNEPILDYHSTLKSNHRLELEKCLEEFRDQINEIPIVINGKNYFTGAVKYQRLPFEHKEILSKFHYADQELIHKAINSALNARIGWESLPISRRLEVIERAADLVSGKYRQKLNAATMLGQAKTVKQAEIDAAAETADFFRFNAHYVRQLSGISQPISPQIDEKNRVDFRSLGGFVGAISPFNFTAIAANLATAPSLLGNSIVWKPSDTAILSNYVIFQVLQEAGFPDGVINFVPSEGLDFGRIVTSHSELAGINFTGSLATFRWLWSEVGLNIRRYGTFPRLVGECGGKNYHFMHSSADLDVAIAQTIRSSFEYSGQKCSACSRLYVPQSIWTGTDFRDRLVHIASNELKVGPSTDFESYTSAVIDQNAFKRISDYINYAKSNGQSELDVICGGEYSDEIGYYVQPTIIVTKNPTNRLMLEEIFGPILTVFVYPDKEINETLTILSESPFALTGSIFAQDEEFIRFGTERLRSSAGNFYINDKSTGAIVGQQPFGGSKLSGTNDKAGGLHYLMKWCSQQTIKTTTKRLVDY